MKHILNNLTEVEKNAIREQHSGGMKVNTEKFNLMVEKKLGEVKPLVNEQVKTLTVGSKGGAMIYLRNIDLKSNLLLGSHMSETSFNLMDLLNFKTRAK
jgi:hypothetical protein